MDCREVRELADSFIAEELLTETNHDILRHLDGCGACRGDIVGRRRLREGLRRAVLNDPTLAPRPEFVEAMRARLAEEARRTTPSGRSRRQGWWLVAAAALLAVSAGVVYSVRGWATSPYALASAAAGDHRNCALTFRLSERPIRLSDAALRYGDWYHVLQTSPPADVQAPEGAFRVLERHVCVYEGHRFAHLVLARAGRKISLLVADAAAVQRPGDADVIPNVDAGSTVVAFRAIGRAAFIVGDISSDEAKQLAAMLSRMLEAKA